MNGLETGHPSRIEIYCRTHVGTDQPLRIQIDLEDKINGSLPYEK